MQALAEVGGETWFKLGDRDLALHVERTRRLRNGETLSAITADIARRFGIASRILPMSDDRVRTMVRTRDGTLDVPALFRRAAMRARGDGIRVRRRGSGGATSRDPGGLVAIAACAPS